MEFDKSELEVLLQWYSLADKHFEERGVYLSEKDYELKDKILKQLKEEQQ